jgi:flavodoxin
MKALVVYESMWGNTEEVAPAIAAGLRELMEVTLAEVGAAPAVQGRKSG